MYHSINFVREGAYNDFKEYAPPVDPDLTWYPPTAYIFPNYFFHTRKFRKGDTFLFKARVRSRKDEGENANNEIRFYIGCYRNKKYGVEDIGRIDWSSWIPVQGDFKEYTAIITVTQDSMPDCPYMGIGVSFATGIQQGYYNHVDSLSIRQIGGTFVKNSWEDFHLISKERLLFNPPEQKTEYVDIPGASLSLDFSTALTGYPVYKNRDGDFEFVFDPYDETSEVMYPNLMNFLHGQKLCAWLEDDPAHVYRGTFSVKKWDTSDKLSKPSISYNTEPYKIAMDSNLFPWAAVLNDGSWKNYTDRISVGHAPNHEPHAEIWITDLEKPCCPKIVVEAFRDTDMVDIFIDKFDGSTSIGLYGLKRGTYERDDFLLTPGPTRISVYTNSIESEENRDYMNVMFQYEKGVL